MIPSFGKSRKHNDYGQGFYATPDPELGKEWAWGTYTKGNKGYLHGYEIDTTGLKILNLTEAGNPSLLSQSAMDTVEKFIEVDCDRNINQFAGMDKKSYSSNQWYWAGMIYAYLHYAEGKSGSELEDLIPLEKMLDYYYLGHEMDIETFYGHIKPVLRA